MSKKLLLIILCFIIILLNVSTRVYDSLHSEHMAVQKQYIYCFWTAMCSECKLSYTLVLTLSNIIIKHNIIKSNFLLILFING